MTMIEHILKVSVVGVHSNFAEKGFRQTDLRFTAELFTNWMDVFLKPDLPQWHNTQALRFLEKLAHRSLAQSTGHSKSRRYRLTRMGLIELIQELVEVHEYCDLRYVVLTFYFIHSYRQRLMDLIRREGSGYSKALQMELEHLFDHRLYLEKQVDYLQRQIHRMKLRISETQKAYTLATKLNRQGESLAKITDQVSLAHPYELDNQKPMSQLFREIEPELRLWEITEGNQFRADVLWATQLKTLENNLKTLKELAKL